MHRVVLASLASLLMAACAVGLGGCGGSRPAGTNPPGAAAPASRAPDKPRDEPPLATPGEHMQYKLSLQGIELASYDLAIGDDVVELAGKRAIVVQSHAKVTGFASFVAKIDDRFTSWVDVTNGRPLRFQVDEYASGSKTKIEHATVDLAGRDGDAIQVMFHANEEADVTERQLATHPVAWDFNAFMLALRSMEGPIGTPLGFEVFRSRYLWHVDVTIKGKETLVTELGDLPALRIEGRTYKLDRKGARDAGSTERVFTIWISDDDGRVPLEIRATTDYGDLKMRIVDYQPGSAARLR